MVTLNTSAERLWGRDPVGRQELISGMIEAFGTVVTRQQVLAHSIATTGKTPAVANLYAQFLFNNKLFRAGRGQYTLVPFMLNAPGAELSNIV